MKKRLLLSCVTCLLALGLVTACNNDDEVEEPGDTVTQDEDTGNSGDTGTGSGGGSGASEAVTLENYTLTFTFMVGDTEDTIPDGATIYISYGPQGESWGGFIALDDSNSVTFATITTGTYEYKLVIYDGEDDVSWSNCAEITTSNQSFVASEADEGGQAITITSTSTLAEIVATEGQSSVGEEVGTIDVTVALKLDGSRTTDITTWYIDGFDWAGVEPKLETYDDVTEGYVDYCSRTMTAADSSASYDYYYDFGEQYVNGNYTFGITPDAYKWHDNLSSYGLVPDSTLLAALEAVTDGSALGLSATHYKAGSEADYSDYTYTTWFLDFYDLTDASALESAESLVIVLTVDYTNVDNTNWSNSGNEVVTAVDLVLDGTTYCSLPAAE